MALRVRSTGRMKAGQRGQLGRQGARHHAAASAARPVTADLGGPGRAWGVGEHLLQPRGQPTHSPPPRELPMRPIQRGQRNARPGTEDKPGSAQRARRAPELKARSASRVHAGSYSACPCAGRSPLGPFPRL